MSMKWDDSGIKTHMARARGLGASHHGVGAWITLRVLAIAALPLSIWFAWFVHESIGMDHAAFKAFLAQPCNAVAMILFVIAVFWHACLGCREIVEDYIHCECMKIAKLIGMYCFFFAAAVFCVFCVLKISFGG